jgi:hypothetical protein
MLVLDSNTIYYFRGDPEVVPRLQAHRPEDLAVPAIVEYELRFGQQESLKPLRWASSCFTGSWKWACKPPATVPLTPWACKMMDASAPEGVQAFIDKRSPAWPRA